MCEPTFEEWFSSFAAELERLNGQQVDFERAYDTYLPASEDGVCGGVCAAWPLALTPTPMLSRRRLGMMRFAPFTRDFYIPKGSIRIADRNSDGVIYVYRSAKDRPAAMAFHGKAVKPD